MPNILYRPATIAEIYELRFAVLRPSQPPIMLHFPGDGDAPPKTWHFGAFLETPDGPKNIACLTIFTSAWNNASALQLRGMAVDPDHRSGGIGTRLLKAAEAAVAQNPVVSDLQW